MKRRVYPRNEPVRSLFRDMNLERMARGWRLHPAGLACGLNELSQVMTDMGLYPPVISPAGPAVIPLPGPEGTEPAKPPARPKTTRNTRVTTTFPAWLRIRLVTLPLLAIIIVHWWLSHK